ncbi:MAG: hypothetical protein OHK0046_13350 [Anaerolineae bacterium]
MTQYAILGMLLLLAGCQGGSDAPATPTPLIISRRLATLAPTPTLSEDERRATQAVLATTPTAAPPTLAPTITPYIGIFRGESQVVLNPVDTLEPLAPAILPTEGVVDTTQLICGFAPDAAFGTSWATEPRALNTLGCPIQERFGFNGLVQVFEGGVVYANPSTNEVWAIAPSTLLSAGNYWFTGTPLPLTTLGVEAPPGLLVPDGVIGQAWMMVLEARSELGFARTPQQPIDINLQRFEGGTLFLDVTVGQVFALLVDGTAYGPFEP